MDLDAIELYCNFDFEPEIKKKYGNMIIDIFNNECTGKYYDNNMDADMMIIIALYDISKENYESAIEMLEEAIKREGTASLRAICTLGILYNILNDKEKSINYFNIGAEKGHILSSTNLAYECLCQGEFDLFLKYNQIGLDNNDDNALINQGIYLWNVSKHYNKASDIFKKIINTNYRACYEYAKLVGNLDQKKELLLKAIQLKPKKIYIDMLKNITTNFERYEFYKKYNIKNDIFKNYDNVEFNCKFNLSKFSRCPACFNSIKQLFTLQCNHSFCSNCIKKYCNKKCCVC